MRALIGDESAQSVGLSITTEWSADTLVLALYGELDLATARALEDRLEIARSCHPERLVVDLSGLHFMDSSGVHALVRAHRRALEHGQQLHLLQGSHRIARVFEQTGTAALFCFEQ